ncbi:MAG TPA: DUF420 domain-containing protein [Pyrinomonadaceae bacterium]|jgi:plastocyanin/uncharacterized membrane protein YozB (DUF420 family)
MLGMPAGSAPSPANLNLAAQVAMGLALLAGMLLARSKRYRAHAICQSAVVLLNLIPILGYMLPVFRRGVLPGVPAHLGSSFYAWPTAHAALGVVAELLALYIILRAGTNLLPEALRFDNYKPWMRTALVLWWLVIALGVGTYYNWYSTSGAQATPQAQAGAPGPTPAPAGTPQTVTVEMRNVLFAPKELTVAPGTTVVWKDAVGRHSVKADDGSFESEILPTGGEFRHTFTQPGRYPYYCTLHGAAGGHDMAGVVTVAR